MILSLITYALSLKIKPIKYTHGLRKCVKISPSLDFLKFEFGHKYFFPLSWIPGLTVH